MKRRLNVLLLILLIALPAVAVTPRTQPLSWLVERPTVLTTEQTSYTIPGGHIAQHTWIVNRGTGTLYIKFEDGTINTSTDLYLSSGESFQHLDVPWKTIELLATGASASVELLVTY